MAIHNVFSSPKQVADRWIFQLNDAIANRDYTAAASLFAADSYWRGTRLR